MQASALNGETQVKHMHWGGGTPNFFTLDEVGELSAHMREHFEFDPLGEYSIELDPRYADPEYVAGLHQFGFNRLSLGVQDFDHDVQRVVHRVQSGRQTREVIDRRARQRLSLSEYRSDLRTAEADARQASTHTLDRVIGATPTVSPVYLRAPADPFKPQRRILEVRAAVAGNSSCSS